jgi:hypothetical protein
MATLRMSREDAINVYALTMAYLYDTPYDTATVAKTMYVKERSAGVFHFWEKDDVELNGEQAKVVAICRYRRPTKTWTIQLMTGAELNLADTGSVWEVVNEED